MNISNNYCNYDYQTNFKGVRWENIREEGKETVKQVFKKRIKSSKFSQYIEELEQKFKDSPITLKFGFADGKGDRLDAQVYTKDGEHFKYLEENRWANFFSINPINFIKRAFAELKNMEKEVNLSIK